MCGTSIDTAPPGLEHDPDPLDEVVEIRHVGEHVVGDDQVGGARPAETSCSASEVPKPTMVSMSSSCAASATFPAGSTQGWHAELSEVAQQISVVAGDLEHQARVVEPRSFVACCAKRRAWSSHESENDEK